MTGSRTADILALFFVTLCVLFFLLCFKVSIYLRKRGHLRTRLSLHIIVASGTILGISLMSYIIYYHIHPFGPTDRLRVLGEIALTEKGSLVVTQSFNGLWTEPYSVSIWLKHKQESSWIAGYVDHEDSWWKSAEIIPLEKESDYYLVTKQGKDRLLVDVSSLKYYDMQYRCFRSFTDTLPTGWEPKDGATVPRQASMSVPSENSTRSPKRSEGDPEEGGTEDLTGEEKR